MSKNLVRFTISNPALSFLLHDCVKSSHNQNGFLFGEVHKKITNVTSDSEAINEKIEITVSITSSWPLNEPDDALFSSDGNLNGNLLDSILGDCKKDVVGWYSFSRNQDLSPSIFQLFLAHQFCNYFSNIQEDLFLCFRMTTKIIFGEHFTFTNKFVCTTGPDISNPVELHIRQLGDSCQSYNDHQPITEQSETYDNVLGSLRVDSQDQVQYFRSLQSCLSAKLSEQIEEDALEQTKLDSILLENKIPASPEASINMNLNIYSPLLSSTSEDLIQFEGSNINITSPISESNTNSSSPPQSPNSNISTNKTNKSQINTQRSQQRESGNCTNKVNMVSRGKGSSNIGSGGGNVGVHINKLKQGR